MGVVNKIGVVAGVTIMKGRWAHRSSRSPLSSVNTTDSADSTSTTSSEDFNASREQPSTESGISLVPHQSRGYSDGPGNETSPRLFARHPSVCSQDFADNSCSNRAISPQIKAYGPDGRHYPQHEILHAASSYPPTKSSRSPSPARATSLDARCGSPASYCGSVSPSQTSLSSLATGATSSCGSFSGAGHRSLSPLPIPSAKSLANDNLSTGNAPPASPLGTIQPDLYTRTGGPVFFNSPRSGKSLGQLHLRLKYDFDKSDLDVHLIEAQDLAGSERGGFSDPYVKVTLSPEVDSRKRQTSIHPNDPKPFFDQHFKFPVSHDDLQDKVLLLQVFDYDRYSRSDIVGSLRISMDQLNLASSTSPVEVWGDIAREKKPPEEKQEVLLSLSYLPSAERLTVVMLKARNLFPLEGKQTMDPYVKVSLLCGDNRVKRRKTAVAKATKCPVWNEALTFNVPAGSLLSSAVEVCVLDSCNEHTGADAMVGSCIVGPGVGSNLGSETGTNHWLDMTRYPRKGISMWHILH